MSSKTENIENLLKVHLSRKRTQIKIENIVFFDDYILLSEIRDLLSLVKDNYEVDTDIKEIKERFNLNE